jgi:hypothetical protein
MHDGLSLALYGEAEENVKGVEIVVSNRTCFGKGLLTNESAAGSKFDDDDDDEWPDMV